MYDHLNTASQHPYIPPEAFLYFPTSKNDHLINSTTTDILDDDFIVKTGKDTFRRMIFQGNTVYIKFQQQKLNEFQQYLKKKQIHLDSRWNKCWRLRWLQSTGYNFKQTVQDMTNFIKYQQNVKQLKMSSNVQKHLNSGVFYLCGRDSKYRPIIVLDIKKMVKLQLNDKQIIEVQEYFFQFIIKNMLIPGQVQNWVNIIDVGYEGVMSMMGPMKASIGFLQSTYRCRMFVSYIIRPSGTCSFLWGIAKKFLQEDTIKKIVFIEDSQRLDQLLQYCNQSQLEQRFGGKLQNLNDKNFWPPRLVSNFYGKQNVQRKLISKEQYRDSFKKFGENRTKIYEPFTIPPTKRINVNKKMLIQLQEIVKNSLGQTIEDSLDELNQLNMQAQQMGSIKSFSQIFYNKVVSQSKNIAQ